jgi:hypothetical protein
LTAPYDIEPLDVIGAPLAVARISAQDKCVDLPPVPGVSACLVLEVVPADAVDECIVVSLDQADQQNGKLRRGSTVRVGVRCSAEGPT